MYCNHLYKPLKIKNMKNLIITAIFFLISFISFSQKIKFLTSDWSYLITNPKDLTIDDYEKILRSGGLNSSQGLNYYDIDLDNKIYIHGYLDDSGENFVYNKTKIEKLISNEKYIKFEVKTKDFGVVNCIIPKNKKLGLKMVFSCRVSNSSSKMIGFI